MQKIIEKLAHTLLACTFLLGAADCGIKELANCRAICDKKQECGTNSSYNVDSCTRVCSDTADRDSEYARKVNTCKECVEPLSCTDYKVATCLLTCPSLP